MGPDNSSIVLAEVFQPSQVIEEPTLKPLAEDHYAFPIKGQPGMSSLCWAAVVSSICEKYGEVKEMCLLQNEYLEVDRDCCQFEDHPICDHPKYTWDVLTSIGYASGDSPLAGAPDFDRLKVEVKARQPIVGSTGIHVVVVHGWSEYPDSIRKMDVSDPDGPSRKLLTFNGEILTANSGPWGLTYFTKDKEE